MLSIKTRVAKILWDHPETRDNRAALFFVRQRLYPSEVQSLPTVDRDARRLQNVV
jgi:hypothetical protein